MFLKINYNIPSRNKVRYEQNKYNDIKWKTILKNQIDMQKGN